MNLIRAGRLYLNPEFLVQAEELDEPVDRLDVVMAAGEPRRLDGEAARVVRAYLDQLRRCSRCYCGKARLARGQAMPRDARSTESVAPKSDHAHQDRERSAGD